MKKPRSMDCEKLCESYETCTLTHCGRRKGFRDGGDIIMMQPQESYKWNINMRVRLYREQIDLKDSGNNLRKKRV